MLMHAVHFRYAPRYISNVITLVSTLSGRSNLRSAANFNYDVQRTRSNIEHRAFSIAGLVAWNGLPRSLEETRCLSTFKRLLKLTCFLDSNSLFYLFYLLFFLTLYAYYLIFYICTALLAVFFKPLVL